MLTNRNMPKRKMYKRRRKTVPKHIRQFVQSKINVNQETKHVNSNVVSLGISSTATNVDVLNIAQGTDRFERVGNDIRVTGFYGRFQMIGGDATNVIRAIMYIPKDPSATLTGANTYGLIDPNVATILYDRLHVTTLNGPNTKVFTMAKKFKGKGLHVEWDDTGTIKKNRIRLLFVSDSGASLHPTLDYHWACYYKDA